MLTFLGNLAPNIAPSLLIAFVSIRIILEFLKERRELLESFRAERKEWRDDYDQLAKEIGGKYDELVRELKASYDQASKDYRASAVEFAALGRDMVNQMHALKGEITKFIVADGRRKTSGGSDD